MLVPGLRYSPAYLSEAEQADLVTTIEALPWLTDLQRRVQHYGYRYDYSRRSLSAAAYLGPLPQWLEALAARYVADGFTADRPNQVIVNEYQPGQGISAHIDCAPCFGATILSLSLLSSCVLLFSHTQQEERVPVLLEPRSLVVMQGDARSTWKHAILPRKRDEVNGQIIARRRRLSLTFRTVLSTE
jgi:alkylated DNA repair dioxygenase AlkB